MLTDSAERVAWLLKQPVFRGDLSRHWKWRDWNGDIRCVHTPSGTTAVFRHGGHNRVAVNIVISIVRSKLAAGPSAVGPPRLVRDWDEGDLERWLDCWWRPDVPVDMELCRGRSE